MIFKDPKMKEKMAIVITGCDTGFANATAKKLDAYPKEQKLIQLHATTS